MVFNGISQYLGKLYYNDLTTTSLEIMFSKGNHPQMAELFRLVKYDNLPRNMGGLYIYIETLGKP